MICISVGKAELLPGINALQPDLVEIRYDLLDVGPDIVSETLSATIGQIATCRPGKYSERERLEIFKRAIDLGAAYIDVEFESSESFLSEVLSCVQESACSVILSYHNFEYTPGTEELEEILEGCYKKGGAVAKLACKVNMKSDNARLLSLYSHEGRKVIIGMGDLGRVTRYSSLELGAEFTFASFSGEDATAPGQLTYQEFQSINKILNNK